MDSWILLHYMSILSHCNDHRMICSTLLLSRLIIYLLIVAIYKKYKKLCGIYCMLDDLLKDSTKEKREVCHNKETVETD